MKIIIIGAGEVGYHFAEWLALEKKAVVVIDINPEAIRRVGQPPSKDRLFSLCSYRTSIPHGFFSP